MTKKAIETKETKSPVGFRRTLTVKQTRLDEAVGMHRLTVWIEEERDDCTPAALMFCMNLSTGDIIPKIGSRYIVNADLNTLMEGEA